MNPQNSEWMKIGRFEYRKVTDGILFQLQRRRKNIFGKTTIESADPKSIGLFWFRDFITGGSDYADEVRINQLLRRIENAGGE